MTVLLKISYYIYNFVFRPMHLVVMSSFFSVGSPECRLFLVHCMATKKSVVLIVVIQMARYSLELLLLFLFTCSSVLHRGVYQRADNIYLIKMC